jgi:hypothetical protein
MKRTLAMLILYCSLPALGADTKPTADVLNRWVGGTWVSDAHFFDTDYSKARTGSSVTKCAWSPDHIFIVCDQAVKDSGEPLQFLSVYAFDPKTGMYHFFGLSPEGDRPRTSDVSISADGAHWEYLMKTEIRDKPVWFRTINQFKGNDQVEWWTESSSDEGQHWTKTGEGSEKRQK